ncbi:PE-PPE domain-containing protein [Mycolicibacterium aurum]|uniref:PE-PPE domain-containing protein n=1 Tax=Mycolicibacterium aurum TaxID=1791 RepID=A0A3S4RPB4_MYCAU|nr:PE-PPE domain-containing protein [Mycolicibacterium aurum]VEG55459.1 PE-PPE domain-containing protein [Mycolicibacterium aurum]
MHSALRPYVTTGLALVGSSVIALAPLAPPAPAQGAAIAAKQVTQDVTLSATVITINPSPDAVDMNEALQGKYCNDASGNTCVAMDYLPVWTTPGNFGLGVAALRQQLAAAAATGEDVTVFGFSEGAVVASQWLESYLKNPEGAVIPQNLTFVVIGNPSRRAGGASVPWGTAWPDSQFKVIDVARQYDPTADVHNPLNALATLNATMGFFTNHLGNSYKDVDLDDPANIKWTEGNTEYVFVPAKTLPLVEPLRWLGLDKLADDLTGPLAYLIEQGYDRDDHINLPPLTGGSGNTANPTASNPFYAPINILETIANIPYYAVQGTNRFANAMRASGSWWVYTPVNVLGWDPANPEMTRAFVDFLVAIPSISGPMGEIADYWARANLPMNAGCTGFPPCPDPSAITDQMFKVMLWDLFNPEGFTFTDPITPQYNPISDVEAYWGQELGLTGDPVEWYGETIHLEPFAETKSFWEHLTSTPEGIKTPTLQEQIDAFKNLADGLTTTWNPFVPKSYVWNPSMTPFAYLARPFAKLLCPSCNAVDPFMPTDWKVGRDIYPGAYIPPSVKDLYDAETGKYIGPAVPGVTDVVDDKYNEESGLGALNGAQTDEDAESDSSALRTTLVSDTTEDSTEESAEDKDVISTAVQNLLSKFDKTPAEDKETPAEETPAEETPAEETPAEETPAEETPAEETPAEETPAEETPAEETPAAETPAEPKDDAPAADADKPATGSKGSGGKHRKSDTSESDTAASDTAKSESKSEAKSESKSETKTESKSDDKKDSSASSSSGSSGSGGGSAGE